jgi:choline kinase
VSEPVRAVMLAAGVGQRLSGGDDRHPPKSLLAFGGRTLLERHLAILRAAGVAELMLVVGYHAERIEAELERLGAGSFVRTVHNPDFRRGSLLSLWTAREALRGDRPILFMDADVLYHPELVGRLLHAPRPDALLYDRELEPGDEPVKLCLRGGLPVEFRKVVSVAFDEAGEWPGFLRLSAATAARLSAVLERFVAAGRVDEPYEEAIREVLLADPAAFAIVDVTDLPWIEIDFPADRLRAEREILPRLPDL